MSKEKEFRYPRSTKPHDYRLTDNCGMSHTYMGVTGQEMKRLFQATNKVGVPIRCVKLD